MKAIRRIWQDVRAGRNLEIYITAIVSLGVAVLGALQITSQQVVSAAILAVLALVSYFLLSNRRSNESIEDKLSVVESSIGSPACFLPERRFLTQLYAEKTLKAQSIDIVAVSMQSFLDNTRASDLANWILSAGKRIRMLVLWPGSSAAQIRGDQENIDLAEKIVIQVNRLSTLCGTIQRQITGKRQCKGSLEVRFYDGVPLFSYFRADTEMIIGLYYSHITGLESESIQIRDTDALIYKKMRGHFDALWEGRSQRNLPAKERVVCEISDGRVYLIDVGSLNRRNHESI